MPGKLKKLVRKRMAKTGERYATALAHVRARSAARTAGDATPVRARADYAPDLIVTRYFGQPITFAIVPVHGRCVMMLAPRAGQPLSEQRPLRWRLLGTQAVQ